MLMGWLNVVDIIVGGGNVDRIVVIGVYNKRDDVSRNCGGIVVRGVVWVVVVVVMVCGSVLRWLEDVSLVICLSVG